MTRLERWLIVALFLMVTVVFAYAANQKLSSLSDNASPIGADILYLVDGVGGSEASKKVKVSNLVGADGTPSASGTYRGFIISGVNAGEAIDAGEIVYMDDTSNEWMLADADVVGEYPAIGMAAAAGTDGNAMDVLIQGVARLDSWSWTAEGVTLYLDDTTPGAMIELAGIPSDADDCVQVLATVLTVVDGYDTILFNADPTFFLDDGT